MKRIIASVLVLVFALSVFCACADNKSRNNSSTVAEPEKNTSTITTTSEASSEIDTESEESSSSKKDKNSSKVSDKTSSKPSSSNATSSSNSQSVKLTVNNRMDVVMCGFDPKSADYYGSTKQDGLREMEDVIAAGYVNALSVKADDLCDKDIWNLVAKYNLGVWCLVSEIFDSDKENIEQYMQNINKAVEFVKQKDEWYSRFKGFWYDEKVFRGETSEDFLAETKYVYQKFGKRTYAVLATGEFANASEDAIFPMGDPRIKPEALKYITDVTFSNHRVDVREGAPNGKLYENNKNTMPGIVDGPSYYREYTKLLLSKIDHPVNLWYAPCARTLSIAGGLNGLEKADEEYCLAHLEFLYNELKQREYAGGLLLSIYNISKGSSEKGLQHFLVVESEDDSDEMYKIYPQIPKWKKYSERLCQIVKEYNSQKANLIRKP